jgi:SEC-C motif-containing protein
MKSKAPSNCPCGLNSYAKCCKPYHDGENAPDAEKLMRSRYSAYVLKNESYLLKTWHISTRPQEPLFNNSENQQWLELQVKQFKTGEDQKTAQVEFIAIYKINGKAYRLHEISDFVLEDGQWFYVDGQFPDIK